jgi:hypothetical protein
MMLGISYAGSPLVGEHPTPAAEPPPAPAPGDRYPDRTALHGTGLLTYGAVDEPALARLRDRWRDLVAVRPGVGDPRHVSLPAAGAILVRPDGHIGFRATLADGEGLAALDVHLQSYLVPA